LRFRYASGVDEAKTRLAAVARDAAQALDFALISQGLRSPDSRRRSNLLAAEVTLCHMLADTMNRPD
jgi:hypothetical protein